MCHVSQRSRTLRIKAKYIYSAQTPVYWMESTEANQNKKKKQVCIEQI